MMKTLVTLLAFVALASAKSLDIFDPNETNAYGYFEKEGFAIAEKIRAAEQKAVRIVGGSAAQLGECSYQLGLIISFLNTAGQGVCGGSLIGANVGVTAAHCWNDGQNQASSFEVVVGSIQLFNGGTRQTTSNVKTHESWTPSLIRNDVAVIKLSSAVGFNNNIAPIALATGSDTYAGSTAKACGFGIIQDNGSVPGYLSYVSLNIIENSVCFWSFPFIIQSTNICTDGSSGKSTCSGDSGGPLVVTKNGQPVLVGITSFGSAAGCQKGYPAAFTRVSSYTPWIENQLLNV